MKKYIPVLLLVTTPVASLLTCHLLLLMNLQFTAWPEMFSYPYLKNNGFLLYKDMIHPYPPILTLLLSYTYKIFGYDLKVLQIFSWVVSLSSGVFVWLLAKQFTKSEKVSFLALAFFVVFQPILDGNMMWFDNAVVLPLLAGTYFLIREKLFLSGLFLAIAGFTKQTGGLFYAAVLIFLLIRGPLAGSTRGPLVKFLIGPFVFGVPLLIRLIQEDAVEGFFRWVIFYPVTSWSSFPGYVHTELSNRETAIIAIMLLPVVFLITRVEDLKNTKIQALLISLVLSIVSIYPRFSFFHFQSTLAFLSVFYVLIFNNVKKGALILSVGTICLLVLLWPKLKWEWGRETRFYGQAEIELARSIEQSTDPSERVFLQGLHSNMYVFAHRLPPEPWGDNFGWYFELPGIQEEFLKRWEQNPPQTAFWRKPSSGNWYDLGTYQPAKIVDYVESNYSFEKDLNNEIQIWRIKN